MDATVKKRWMSHLCGVCLTLRDEAGQASRVLTGYDVILLSVLVEAQAGRTATETAGPCALRGMRTAEVVPATHPGTRLAAAGSLLAGAAAIEDKLRDRDLPWVTEPAARRWSARATDQGRRLAAESGLDADALTRAGLDAAAAEGSAGTLDEILAPSGRAVAALFAHTAEVAGKPANAGPLGRAGDSFGRLVHLLDAVEDFWSDRRHGRFNPLDSTATPEAEARRLSDRLLSDIEESMADVDMEDPELALTLLGPVLRRSVSRHLPAGPSSAAVATADPVGPSSAAVATAALAAPVLLLGIFGGGRRRPRYYNDPYGPPPGYGYGYRRRGPSCCDLLACDCCANMACNDCCGGCGGDDECCVCCC